MTTLKYEEVDAREYRDLDDARRHIRERLRLQRATPLRGHDPKPTATGPAKKATVAGGKMTER
jgi:hypothetical protein